MNDIMEQLMHIRDGGIFYQLGEQFGDGIKSKLDLDSTSPPSNEEVKNLQEDCEMLQRMVALMAQGIVTIEERLNHTTTIEEVIQLYKNYAKKPEGEEDEK